MNEPTQKQHAQHAQRVGGLKPCPFCGKLPELLHGYTVGGAVYQIRHECRGVEGLIIKTKNWTTKVTTIETWNRRAET